MAPMVHQWFYVCLRRWVLTCEDSDASAAAVTADAELQNVLRSREKLQPTMVGKCPILGILDITL